MEKKITIGWVTASYMLQVDLPVLKYLKDDFDIDWYFWGRSDSSTGMVASEYAKLHGINLQFCVSPYMDIDPRISKFQHKMLSEMGKSNYDVCYFNISTFPWLLSNIKKHLDFNKVVLAMHHGFPHSGMRFKPFYFPFLKYLNGQDCYLQYFSNYQSGAYRGKDPGKKYVIPLALNDFGSSEVTPGKNKVVFTYFGNIIPSKNIELLIEAACRLWEEMPERFIVRIVGHCRNWEKKYSGLVRYPETFDIVIRRIKEDEIPDLFSSSHYLVLPYSSVTQSGPLRIAYGYNLPVIASDLEGFRESVIDGETGYLFHSDDAGSLKEVMKKLISEHPHKYETLRKSQKRFVDNHLSIATVCRQYAEMFARVAKV